MNANGPEEERNGTGVDDRQTGLPILRSWRAVYGFVFGVFVLWLLLLTAVTRFFS